RRGRCRIAATWQDHGPLNGCEKDLCRSSRALLPSTSMVCVAPKSRPSHPLDDAVPSRRSRRRNLPKRHLAVVGGGIPAQSAFYYVLPPPPPSKRGFAGRFAPCPLSVISQRHNEP